MLGFDIETAPLPDEFLENVIPPLDESQFEIGEFNESKVKTGNLKDPAKIQQKIDDAYAKHQSDLANQEQNLAKARQDHFAAFKANATLNAAHSKVLAIGLYGSEKEKFAAINSDDRSEADILAVFWSKATECLMAKRRVVGVNIFTYDLPFMVRRSWSLGVHVPAIIVSGVDSKWPKWHQNFLDVGSCWLLGCSWSSTKWGFETLATAFGTAGKTEDIGATWWEVWAEDRERALDYLRQDCIQPTIWAGRMGFQ